MIIQKAMLINNKKLGLLLLIAVFVPSLISCHKGNDKDSRPLAVVYDSYLYKSDIKEIFPQGITKADSVKILNAYVDQWVRNKLMLRLAENNLTDAQKDVSKQLEDYRSSLLIFKYQQEYILQKLDTAVTSDEISSFYNSNMSNFMLNETLVKALYIKVRKDTPFINKIKELYKSSREEDIKALENIVYQVAEKYDYFGDKWLSFNVLQRQLPYPLEDVDNYLHTSRSVEMEDGNYNYFIYIRSVMFKGQTSPLEYEEANVKSIIINKRKQKLINDLDNNVYNDALDHKKFQTF